jgi:hypothetical protein
LTKKPFAPSQPPNIEGIVVYVNLPPALVQDDGQYSRIVETAAMKSGIFGGNKAIDWPKSPLTVLLGRAQGERLAA